MPRTLSGRVGSRLQILLGVAVFALCAGLVCFGWTARQTAKDSQRIAEEATASLDELRAVIARACAERRVRDKAVTAAAQQAAEINERQAELSKVAANLPPAQQAERTRLFLEGAAANRLVVTKEPVRRCEDYAAPRK